MVRRPKALGRFSTQVPPNEAAEPAPPPAPPPVATTRVAAAPAAGHGAREFKFEASGLLIFILGFRSPSYAYWGNGRSGSSDFGFPCFYEFARIVLGIAFGCPGGKSANNVCLSLLAQDL